jgi:hypothetical protein
VAAPKGNTPQNTPKATEKKTTIQQPVAGVQVQINTAVSNANKAIDQANDLLDKKNVTKADLTKIATLQKQAEDALNKAKDLGATSKNTAVADALASLKEVKADAAKATPKPTVKETPKPTGGAGPTTPRPPLDTGTPKPTPKPTDAPPRPTAGTPKPTTAPPRPTAGTPKPTTATPKPTTATPKPTTAGATPKPTTSFKRADDLEPTPSPTIVGATPNATITRPTPFPTIIDGAGKTPEPTPSVPQETPDATPGGTPSGSPPPTDTPGGTDGTPTPSPSGSEEPPGETPEPSPSPEPSSPTPSPTPSSEETDDMWWLILRAKLLAAGLPTELVDQQNPSTKSYFKELRTDFWTNDSATTNDIVIDQFFYNKTYTTKSGNALTSPYYTAFGKYNEKLGRPMLPKDLVPTVLGYKDLAARYKISSKYIDDDAIVKYLQNDVSVAEFDDRLNTAALKSVMADPFYVNALKQLNYITDASQLTDFFLDPQYGTVEMQNRQKNAAFVTEAVRRVTPETQLEVDLDFAKQQAARYSAQGYTEAQVSTLAATGFENVAEALPTTVKLAGIYDRPTLPESAFRKDIQSELQQEEFMNLSSARRKRLKEREMAAFSGAAGIAKSGRGGGGAGTAGIL